MRLTYNACIIVLRKNSKINDQTSTKLNLPQNTNPKFKKKNRLKLEENYSHNPQKIRLSFSLVSLHP